MTISGTRAATTSVFDSIDVGALRSRNRIVMSPMTRSRAYGTTASADMAEYYAQRASAGLIITEGIQPSAIGQGYPDTPGLHSADQVASWRTVTDRVHEAGGVIIAQLMHTGRIGHPETTDAVGNTGLVPVGPSAVQAAGQVFTPQGKKDYVVPVELNEDDIAVTIADFVDSARKAMDAGFDGVEIHGANGYLLHQFLAPNVNQRTDRWGGSIQNRIRLSVEVTRAVADAIGAGRTGIRISPNNGLGDTAETDYHDVYPPLIDALDELGLAYLHLIETGDPAFTSTVRERWDGVLILNAAGADPLDHPQRVDRVTGGDADLVSFGRLFIANPDLVERLADGIPPAMPDLSRAYGGDSTGYTDYPRHADTSPTPKPSDDHASGRVVVITGAAGGVGARLTARFLRNGDTVIATDISEDALQALRDDLRSERLVTVAAAITDEEQVNDIAAAARELGGVDVLLNVAGFFPFDAFADTTAERWRAVIDVNLTGYFLVTHALLPLMKGRGWGRIVNVGSASMFPGVPGQVHYVSAKTGLIGFTRSLAREVGEDGITVNLLTPGLTLTGPVREKFPEELIRSQREGRALQRDQHPDDLVGPMFFLASPDADFVTGQTVNVDGGMFMN